MSVVLHTPDAALAARFAAGDENALATLYRQQYEGLLSAARQVLGASLAHYRGRVAHKAMLDAWAARSRFQNATALQAFLEEAVQQEADVQRRKHAALHHRESGADSSTHLRVPDVEEAMRELLAEVHAPPIDHDAAIAEVLASKRAHTKAHVERVGERPRWVLHAAAGAAVLLGILFLQRWMTRASADVAVDRALQGESVQTLSSGRGQRGTLTLRDGTKATMGSESLLRIPPEFATSQRTVLIEGTATFAVDPNSPNASTPFSVRAGALTVTARGTVFSVRYYPQDATAYVQVAEGAVDVHDRVRNTTREVTSGQAVRLLPNGTLSTLEGVERDVALGWTRDTIVFDHTPLKLVVPELVRWFGLNAHLADPAIGDRPVSMRVALSSSGEATTKLTQAANLGITFGKGDRIEFHDAGAVAPVPTVSRK